MKKSEAQETSQPKLSPAKRRVFVVIALLLPVLLMLGAEGVLRMRGEGGYPPSLRKVGPLEQGGELVLADHAGAVSYFFANPSRPGYNDQYQFVDPKPAGTFRIFLVGESAAKGYPQPRNLASSAFLKAMLQDAWPERTVEVINLGTTAVASFPVLGMMKEALAFEPDLIMIHTGHNEFFGAYGVGSVGSAGTSVWSLKATRWLRSLALVQVAGKVFPASGPVENKTLMEIMVGRSYTAPDDPIRQAAATNLGANIGEMLSLCRKHGVPALVCTMPSNERHLFPVGEDRVDGLGEADRARFAGLLAEGEDSIASDPAAAVTTLTEAVDLLPNHARARFLLGRALRATGETALAQEAFLAARDRDSMPWRATSLHQEAIKAAAVREEGTLCDLEAAFRERSPGGSIGWELMDDHVHPSLEGQALMAETFVATLHQMEGAPAVSDEQLSRVRPWRDYAAELGENAFDHYGVHHGMRILFNVPFVKERNREGFERYQERAAAFEKSLSPEVKKVVREWQSERPHAGGKRPITGMVARQYLREKRYDDALALFQIAQKSVPKYTSWHLEYVYFTLVCREKLAGSLSEPERELALATIREGRFLLRRGFSESGFTERHTGRLHQLRGEWEEAIPFLNASRHKLGGTDLVAADQALFVSLLKTGRTDEARKLAENGVAKSGQYAEFYRRLLPHLP